MPKNNASFEAGGESASKLVGFCEYDFLPHREFGGAAEVEAGSERKLGLAGFDCAGEGRNAGDVEDLNFAFHITFDDDDSLAGSEFQS